jgi:hypothetical protein
MRTMKQLEVCRTQNPDTRLIRVLGIEAWIHYHRYAESPTWQMDCPTLGMAAMTLQAGNLVEAVQGALVLLSRWAESFQEEIRTLGGISNWPDEPRCFPVDSPHLAMGARENDMPGNQPT